MASDLPQIVFAIRGGRANSLRDIPKKVASSPPPVVATSRGHRGTNGQEITTYMASVLPLVKNMARRGRANSHIIIEHTAPITIHPTPSSETTVSGEVTGTAFAMTPRGNRLTCSVFVTTTTRISHKVGTNLKQHKQIRQAHRQS